MQQMCNDLSLTFEPDLRIILAAAEMIRPQISKLFSFHFLASLSSFILHSLLKNKFKLYKA